MQWIEVVSVASHFAGHRSHDLDVPGWSGGYGRLIACDVICMLHHVTSECIWTHYCLIFFACSSLSYWCLEGPRFCDRWLASRVQSHVTGPEAAYGASWPCTVGGGPGMIQCDFSIFRCSQFGKFSSGIECVRFGRWEFLNIDRLPSKSPTCFPTEGYWG